MNTPDEKKIKLVKKSTNRSRQGLRMKNTLLFRTAIYKYMENNNMTQSTFQGKVDLHPSTFINILKGNTKKITADIYNNIMSLIEKECKELKKHEQAMYFVDDISSKEAKDTYKTYKELSSQYAKYAMLQLLSSLPEGHHEKHFLSMFVCLPKNEKIQLNYMINKMTLAHSKAMAEDLLKSISPENREAGDKLLESLKIS